MNEVNEPKAQIEAVPLDCRVRPLPCPFCGMHADLENGDTLYPSGTGWRDVAGLGREYHRSRDVPRESWCYRMHCPITAGGCGAEISGDTEAEALANWNRRA
jgi:hypothetical protein